MKAVAPAAILLFVVALWWLAAGGSPIFPTPWQVVLGTAEMVGSGVLWKHIETSLMRVFVGYFSAVALAIPLGVLMGWFRPLDRALNPLFQLLRPISPIAWTPLAILWFGIGGLSPIFLIFLSSFFPVVVATVAGVRGVERDYIRAARNFELDGPYFFTQVLIPAALPQIITGMRIGLGVAWLVVVAAEMIATESGLGYLIIDARNAVTRYDLVVAAMIIIGIIGLVLDTLMRRLEHVDQVKWRYAR